MQIDNPLLRVGDLIDKRYLVEEMLGRGGMAEVYRVRHCLLQRTNALKIMRIPESLALDPVQLGAFVEQFRLEAEISANIGMSGVVRVHDSGVCAIANGAHPYMVLEYVRGASLSQRLREGAPSSQQIVSWITVFAGTLDSLHQKEVYHLDIKPSNLMLEPPTIVDFGVARVASRLGPVASVVRHK